MSEGSEDEEVRAEVQKKKKAKSKQFIDDSESDEDEDDEVDADEVSINNASTNIHNRLVPPEFWSFRSCKLLQSYELPDILLGI